MEGLKEIPVYWQQEWKMVQLLWKTMFPKILKIKFLYDPAILLDIHSIVVAAEP